MARRKRKKAKADSSAGEVKEDLEAVIEELQEDSADAEQDSSGESAVVVMSEEARQEKMKTIAEMVVNTCMEIYRHENVLVIADPTTSRIGEALYIAASEASDRVLMVVMPKGRHHGEEPRTPVANLMRQQDVILAPTRYSLTHTKARLEATKRNARIATMPGMSLDVFTEGGMTADFKKIKADIAETYGALRRRREVKVSSDSGTDISFEVNWREWNLDDSGICNRPGMVTNLPAGKIFTYPREGTMEGTIVVDGSWNADLLEEPVSLTVEKGRVVDVTGGAEAANLRQTFREAAANMKTKDREAIWDITEFGFGMNPKAKLKGNLLEDEKVLGTCYFMVGSPVKAGGNHVLTVLRNSVIDVDGRVIIEDGKLKVD